MKAGEENANKLKEALALEKKLSSDKNSQVNAGAVVFVLTGARIRIRSLAIFAIKYLFQKTIDYVLEPFPVYLDKGIERES